MEHKIGDLITGKVVKVRPYALFLAFEDGLQGLLHISEISDGYVRDIEKVGTLGDELKVKILDIDPVNSFMRVSFKQVPEEEKFTTHDSQKKNIPEFDSSDFSALKEKLPEWIENSLKKVRENDD